MKDDEALRKVLQDLTIALSEDNKLRNVQFLYDDSKFGDAPSEDKLRINPNHAEILDAVGEISEQQEFALLVDTESHELEHNVVSDLNSVREFVKEYPARPRMAGYVINIVEDTYVDTRRTNRDRGLRPVKALFADLWMENQDPIHEIDGVHKYVAAVGQIARGNGTPKGFDNEDDEAFRDYCAEVRAVIEAAKETYKQNERKQLAHDIMDLIEAEVGEVEAPESVELPIMVIPVDGGDGDPLPEPNEENVEDGDDEGEDGEMEMGMGMSMSGEEGEEGEDEGEDGEQGGAGGESGQQGNESGSGGAGGGHSAEPCPECGYDSPNDTVETVDGMTAARCSAPFHPEADWVGSVEFVAHDDENGVCGFRVKPTGDVPRSQIEQQGYKVVDVTGGVEILEPKARYDDKEDVRGFECPKCGHEWLPTIGSN